MKWTERYNCLHAYAGGRAIGLSVAWKSASDASPAGYEVRVLNRRLKTRFADVEMAKAAAVNLARRVIAEALAELEAP